MAKYPRFMICENPMAEPDEEYILHTQEPRFLAKRVYENPTTDFEIVMEIDNMAAYMNNDVSKLAKLMSRMGDWYISYQNWLNEN
jgi:hypothetical protein